MPKKEDLLNKLDELILVVKERRSNPPAAPPTAPGPSQTVRPVRAQKVESEHPDEVDELLDVIAQMQDLIDEGRLDRAQQIGDETLDEYGHEEEDETEED